jgi:hypothetical protein
MKSEQLSSDVPIEAKGFYEEHRLLADVVDSTGRHRYDAVQDVAKARREYDRADDSYLSLQYDAPKNIREHRLEVRRNALSNLRSTENRYESAAESERQAELSYDRNLNASAEHYNASAEDYHTQAVQDARDAGVEVNFDGDVATNVRPAK